MGFATPIALLALGAIAIPALIHLMRRRDLPKVELPTLAFLTRAKAESRRKLHLIDLLLLLVRMAMIALFALALAKPYRTVVHSYGSGDPIALTVVLDDSMSMMRKDGSDTLLQQAVDRAKELTAHLPEGSEVALVLAGSPARTLGTALRDDATVASTLDAMATTSARGTDMPQAMDLAQAHAMASKLSSKAIVVLSDMAAHASWDRVAWPPPSIPVDLLRIGGDPAPNRFIGTVEVAPDPTLKDSLSVWVDILEAGSAEGPTAPAEVRILVGDEIQAREAVKTTDPNGRVRLWVPTPEGEGIDGKVVLVVDDSIETDNQAGLLLRGDRKLNVLWIHGHLRRYTRAGESRFFEHALEALGRRVRVTQQDPDFFYTQHGKSSDLLWMTHLARPSPGLAKAAREHVEAGGGLVLVPGRDSDFRSWRTTFGDLLPSVPGEIVTEAEPLDLVVPPGSPLEITGLEGAKVTRRLLLERTLTGGEVWLAFSDGTPALVVRRSEKGNVALLGMGLDETWSQTPLRPGFVPLIAEIIQRVSSRASVNDAPTRPGFPRDLDAPWGTVRLQVVDPADETHDLEPDVPFRETHLPGTYRVFIETTREPLHDEPDLAFTVRPDPAESDPTVGSPEPPRAQAGTSGGGTSQQPLAPALFLAMAPLLLLEGLLRLRWRRRQAR